MPKPGFQLFAAKKPDDTFRVFVLGGSTTAGFPYPLHGSFANLLRVRLEPHLPGRRLEVVNCGLTALNSYAVVDFVEELADYDPDLYVVYAGHNEFYGALGPASRVAFGKSRAWVRTLRWVVDLRISRLFSEAIESVRGDPDPVEGQTLMGAMVGRTGIREGDPTWTATLEGYEANLEQIVREAGGVPLLFCEVVSNLRDQYPFESLHAPELSEAEVTEFDRVLTGLEERVATLGPPAGEKGRYGLELELGWAPDSLGRGDPSRELFGDPSEDLDRALVQLCETDPGHAGATFTRARLSLRRWSEGFQEVGEAAVAEAPDEIRDRFVRARDLDAIRFRAPSEINEIIRAVVERNVRNRGREVGLVPTEQAIRSASIFGIPGHDVFVEHLHLTLPGADAVARAIVERVEAEGIFGAAWVPADELTTEDAVSRLGLTPLDFEIAERRVFHLSHRWPYPEDRSATFVSARPPIVQRLAESVIADEVDLAEAHFRLGEIWFGEGKRREALLELTTACEIFPVVPQRFLLAGRLALEEGEVDRALDLLVRGSSLDPGDTELAAWRDRAAQAVSAAAGARDDSGGGATRVPGEEAGAGR